MVLTSYEAHELVLKEQSTERGSGYFVTRCTHCERDITSVDPRHELEVYANDPKGSPWRKRLSFCSYICIGGFSKENMYFKISKIKSGNESEAPPADMPSPEHAEKGDTVE